MNAKVSKLLKKFSQEAESLPLKLIKKEYNNMPKNKRANYKENLKRLIA